MFLEKKTVSCLLLIDLKLLEIKVLPLIQLLMLELSSHFSIYCIRSNLSIYFYWLWTLLLCRWYTLYIGRCMQWCLVRHCIPETANVSFKNIQISVWNVNACTILVHFCRLKYTNGISTFISQITASIIRRFLVQTPICVLLLTPKNYHVNKPWNKLDIFIPLRFFKYWTDLRVTNW